MSVEYTAPLAAGWNRMKHMLFSPFDLGRWMVLGFTAFLADLSGLMDQAGGSGSNVEFQAEDLETAAEGAAEFITNKWEAILASTGLVILFTALVLILLVVWVAFLWISSRGKFVFLDNVVGDHTRVTAPWKEFKAEGNSLFQWRIALEIISIVIGVIIIIDLIAIFAPTVIDESLLPFSVASLVGVAWISAVLGLIAVYMSLFLHHFVVPIMYRHRVGVMDGWRRFLTLFRERTVELLLYGVFMLLLHIASAIVIGVFGLATCCVGFLVMAVPYIGSVLLLPITLTFRAYSVHFLSQFGDEYRIEFLDRSDAPADPSEA